MTKKSKIAFFIALLLAIIATAFYFWRVYNIDISLIQTKNPLIITARYIVAAIILVVTLILLAISNSNWLLPSLIFAFLIVITVVIYERFESIPKISFNKSTTAKTESKKETMELVPPQWELYKKPGECKFDFSGREIFSNRVGTNGERANTAEVYSGCFLPRGYEYNIIYLEKGEYKQRFISSKPYSVSWRGWEPQIQFQNRPFKENKYGALILRIGIQEGIHPKEGEDFVIFATMEDVKIYGELNITRAADNYSDTAGSKISESTLTIEIRRRPLQR